MEGGTEVGREGGTTMWLITYQNHLYDVLTVLCRG